jgi:hypothetical protein
VAGVGAEPVTGREGLDEVVARSFASVPPPNSTGWPSRITSTGPRTRNSRSHTPARTSTNISPTRSVTDHDSDDSPGQRPLMRYVGFTVDSASDQGKRVRPRV